MAKAPNTEQMSAEMREKGRQAFLKPSKIKDVLYHGSLNDINEFKPGAKGLLGPGVYLTPHPGKAGAYANFQGRIKGDATGTNVMPVHAQIKNPYYFDRDPLVPMTSEHVERLKALGHDAAILRDTEGGINQVNVFHPHQIKSAIGNRGTYDTTNPDITKAQGGAVHPTTNQMRQAIAARQAMPRLAGGGEPPATPHPGYLPTDNPKRVLMPAEGPGGIKGIVQPSHMWLGGKLPGGSRLAGMGEINEARASVYGGEQRPPLKIGQVGALHKRILDAHFQKPVAQQLADESSALEKLKAAKHISGNANTLDKSEKLDTVNHETDSEGRHYTGIASKGVAGHSLYTSGHGAEQKRHVINTCPGQTVGCGGGVDANGIVDTSKGICFAPNAEAQYAGAAIRRACHEQAKHDPAMSPDWILAHTGSLRGVANAADKQNKVTLFRPNVVDETDVSSRHVLRHLNKQRRAEGKPGMIANSYGKTNELHDPENGYYVTHSNVGPKTKLGTSIEDHIARDKQRVRNTITATDASGRDFTNDDGNPTPPKNAYAVTDVKRHSPFDQRMQKTITHAKYWGVGKHVEELTPAEKAEGPEGHFNGAGKPVAEDAAHYGHTTVNDHRYDYQKQHILHPRLVQVGKNIDGTPHMIPTDSRFKDDDFLPKNRFKTKNGKQAGAIILTTPTESTSNLQHQASFTHHVGEEDIAHAQARKGEYEIDAPAKQEASRGKEYVQPKGIKFFAHGGSVHITGGRHEGLADDDFSAFPERNFAAQWHHSKRVGIEDITEMPHGHAHQRQKAPVVRAKAGGAIGNVSMDEMLAHTTLGKKAPNVRNIGADEAPDMKIKQYIPPGPSNGLGLPAGGVDFQPEMPGHQLTQAAPAGLGGPAMPGMPGMPPGGLGMPPGAPGPGMPGMPPPLPRNQPGMPTGKPAGLEPPNIPPPKQKPTGSNILSMTPQGQALAALGPMRKMAEGGGVKRKVEVKPTVKDETLQRKIPEMETAVKALHAGIIDHAEYDRIVAKHKPVKPYDFVPQPASDKDAARALKDTQKAHWRGAEQWPAGRKVGLRLDIPAYERHGVWVNSIHDEEGKDGNKYNTSYGPVSSVKNATFDPTPSKAVRVATGEQNKSPFARIKGELHPMSEDEAVKHMQEHLHHPDWAQVGMDPRRHGFFYDRKTLQPVTHSEHVVQIGPLVLAKKPKYGKRETYAHGGGVTLPPSTEQMRQALSARRSNSKA